MTSHSLTVQVPGPLFSRLEGRARDTQRTVEEELLDVLAASVSEENAAQEIAESMKLLDDAALWQSARSKFPATKSAHIEELHDKRQRVGLTKSESQTLMELMLQYERAMLIRSQAIGVLHERGCDVSGLLVQP